MTNKQFGFNDDGTPLDQAHPWNGGNGRLPPAMEIQRLPLDLPPFRSELSIICGPPPAGGKTTFVNLHRSPKENLICLDSIMQQMTGKDEHETEGGPLTEAISARNEMLRSAANSIHRTWFIVSAPDPIDRFTWRRMLQPKRLIVLAPDIREINRRVWGDPQRRGHEERMLATAVAWWDKNAHLASLAPAWVESLGAATKM